MSPRNKQEVIDILDITYSKDAVMDNLEYCDEIEESDSELIAFSVEDRKNKTKKLLDEIDWRGVPKKEFYSMPSLWWEGSDGWNDLPDTDGLYEYLDELDNWIIAMGNTYKVWKNKKT